MAQPPRRASLLVLGLVLAALAPPSPAAASGPLVADAGSSGIAWDGAPLQVEGFAIGGAAPYAFAWSHLGSAARFADPTAASTTFDTAGLAPGDHDLTLTVTDDLGAVASDTVRIHAAASLPLLAVAGSTTGVGLPDEVLLSGADLQNKLHAFTVPGGLARLEGVLDWANNGGGAPGGNDFDWELRRPDGQSATGSQGHTLTKPERVTVANPGPGTWQARVQPFLTTPDAYTAEVRGFAPSPVPTADAGGPYLFGYLDVQALKASVAGGVGPQGAWDLDLDGTYESPGLAVTASFPPGTHTVAFKTTDAAGYEVRRDAQVIVRGDAERHLRLGCGGDPARPYWAMEFTASKNTCWMHGGHHTYDLGQPWSLVDGTGFVYSVEQQFSPPSEYQELPFVTPVHVQGSLDGQSWVELGFAAYQFLEDPTQGQVGAEGRQGLTFTLQGPATFRWLRVHQPLSAMQGLSGFLDNSVLDLMADAAPAPAPAPLAPKTVTLLCTDGHVMEDFFAEHPCTFGGLNRYDTPSFFHTYIASAGTPATLTRVTAVVDVLPWRTDDWFLPLVPQATQVTTTRVFVQTSLDGVFWDTVGEATVPFGGPGLADLPLAGKDARYVRLFPDYHPRYDFPGTQPALHHPEAFFVASALVLEGALP